MLKLCFLIFVLFFHHFGFAVQKCTMPSGVVVYKQVSNCPSDAVKVEQVDRVPDNVPRFKPAPGVASRKQVVKDKVGPEVSDVEAIKLCKIVILLAVKDPEQTNIPYLDSSTTATHYRFFWHRTTKLVRSPNAFRSDVGVPATCYVKKAGGEISYLMLDNKVLINEDRAAR